MKRKEAGEFRAWLKMQTDPQPTGRWTETVSRPFRAGDDTIATDGKTLAVLKTHRVGFAPLEPVFMDVATTAIARWNASALQLSAHYVDVGQLRVWAGPYMPLEILPCPDCSGGDGCESCDYSGEIHNLHRRLGRLFGLLLDRNILARLLSVPVFGVAEWKECRDKSGISIGRLAIAPIVVYIAGMQDDGEDAPHFMPDDLQPRQQSRFLEFF